MDPELNHECRAITGCLKPTNVEDLYLLVGIAPLDIRRDVCSVMERVKQVNKKAHSLFGHTPAKNRLNSRCCFLSTVQPAFFFPKSKDATNGRRDLETDITQTLST